MLAGFFVELIRSKLLRSTDPELVIVECRSVALGWLQRKKKGKPVRTSPFCLRAKFNLERVTPVEHHIDPIGANATPAISRAKVTYFITLANVVSRLTDAVAHV